MPSSSPLPTIAHIPLHQSSSSLYTSLFQITRRHLLIGSDAYQDLVRPTTIGIRYFVLPNAYEDVLDLKDFNLAGWQPDVPIQLRENEEIRCFRLDEESALLAVLTWDFSPSPSGIVPMHLKLLEFPTGRLHPSARAPVIDLDVQETPVNGEEYDAIPPARVEIYEDRVGLLVNERTVTNLRVWNWKKGTLLMERRVSRGDYGQTFSFLSPNVITLASRSSKSVELINITSASTSKTSLQLPSSTPELLHVSCDTHLHPHHSSSLVVYTLTTRPPMRSFRICIPAMVLLKFSSSRFSSLIPWEEWKSFSRSFPSPDPHLLTPTPVDGHTLVLYENRERLRVLDPFTSKKTVLDVQFQPGDYGECIVRSESGVVFGFRMVEDEEGEEDIVGVDILALHHL